MKPELKIMSIPNNTQRVELCHEDKNCLFRIAELHPKHAEDLLKVYNRTEESYDALYPAQ